MRRATNMPLVYCRQHRAGQGPVLLCGCRWVNQPGDKRVNRRSCHEQVAGRSTVGKATTTASPSWLAYTGVRRKEVVLNVCEEDLVPVGGGQLPFRRFLTLNRTA